MTPSIASEDQSSPIIPSDQTQGQGHWSRDDGPSADRSTHMGWALIREVPPRVCEGALTRSTGRAVRLFGVFGTQASSQC